MTKIFCDCCGQEITEKNKNIRISFKEKFEVSCECGKFIRRYNRHSDDEDELAINTIAGFHICLYCIIDAYKSVDNRPIKATIPAQL